MDQDVRAGREAPQRIEVGEVAGYDVDGLRLSEGKPMSIAEQSAWPVAALDELIHDVAPDESAGAADGDDHDRKPA
jgi:hypothetical protein